MWFGMGSGNVTHFLTNDGMKKHTTFVLTILVCIGVQERGFISKHLTQRVFIEAKAIRESRI